MNHTTGESVSAGLETREQTPAEIGVRSDVLTMERIEAVRASLPETDGEPLETPWHRAAINLLIAAISWHLRSRTDYYVGGNMFIHYSLHQLDRREKYRGPDFFFVKNVDGTRERKYWWPFEEDGRYPDFILELQSESTAAEDRTTKKAIYEQTFRTSEYFLYDPETRQLEGWRLKGDHYTAIVPDERGWLWSEQLGLWIGIWEGAYLGRWGFWPRFYAADGQLVLIETEAEHQRAELEKQNAEAERQRSQALEVELTRLKAVLAEKGIEPTPPA